jgi:hypothetical protein
MATPSSPSAGNLPFSGSGIVGRKVMSKIKIGSMKLGGASKKTMDMFTGSGEKRSSADPNVTPRSTDGFDGREGATTPQQRFSGGPSGALESPRDNGARYYRDSVEARPYGLGLSTSTHPAPVEATQPGSSVLREESENRPLSPVSPIGIQPRREGKQGGMFGSAISTVKVPKLFGSSGTKGKHNRTGSDVPQPMQQQQQSPKQKSKFSKFVNDLSNAQLTVSKPSNQNQSSVSGSPPPPRPPDKAQFRSTSEGTGGLRGFFTSDLTGKRVSPQNPTPYSRQPEGSGYSENNSIGAAPRYPEYLEQDRTPARLEEENVYDESALGWDAKLGVMMEFLPHIPREVLALSLKEARGDEERAIGLAVLKSRT